MSVVHRDRAWDVGVVVAANAAVTVGLWVRHSGLHDLSGPGGTATAAGQLAGLLGTYAVLVELLLMSRIGWLERAIGFDRLAIWHRWTGFAAIWLLVSHAGLITVGYAAADHRTLAGELGAFIRHYPDVLMSIVGLALFIAVGVASARAARRRLSRESWYALHLYAYVAVALAFAHQLAVGTDFTNDAVARAWWIGLYAAVAVAIVTWRIGRPLVFNARHRLRVHSVKPEADGVVSIYLSGRHLNEIDASAGQFFLWRFLTPWGWAKAHPFSLSAAPRPNRLRITVKGLGDDTRRMLSLPPGTRVFAEGPYGTFTAERRKRARVALIAGGIGITPLRAILDDLPPRLTHASANGTSDVTLLYRVASERDIAFRHELAAFEEKHGVQVHVLVGADIGDDRTDQLGVPALRKLVPDLAARDVFVCGPPAMVDAVRRRLRMLKVPAAQVHFERFQY